MRVVPIVLALLATGLTTPAGAQDTILPIPRPPEVTESAVARGRDLFENAGNCVACHGLAGVGSDSGPALAEGVWLHGPDSYRGILSRVMHGVPKAYSTRGLAMPMRGWNTLTDQQARDVAAYVWTISHAWREERRVRRP